MKNVITLIIFLCLAATLPCLSQTDTLRLYFQGLQTKLIDSNETKIGNWAKKLNGKHIDVQILAYYNKADYKQYAQERYDEVTLIVNRKARDLITITTEGPKKGQTSQRSRVDVVYKVTLSPEEIAKKEAEAKKAADEKALAEKTKKEEEKKAKADTKTKDKKEEVVDTKEKTKDSDKREEKASKGKDKKDKKEDVKENKVEGVNFVKLEGKDLKDEKVNVEWANISSQKFNYLNSLNSAQNNQKFYFIQNKVQNLKDYSFNII